MPSTILVLQSTVTHLLATHFLLIRCRGNCFCKENLHDPII